MRGKGLRVVNQEKPHQKWSRLSSPERVPGVYPITLNNYKHCNAVHVLDFDELSGADEKDGAGFKADHRHAAGFSFAGVKHPFAARHQQHRSGFLYR